MYNVVISFHASMSQKDWLGRPLTSLFPNPGTQTLFIDGGSTFGCSKVAGPTANCPFGKDTTYSKIVNRYTAEVPRSPLDPKYKADDPKTHTRTSHLWGWILSRFPQLQGQQVRTAIIGYSEGCGGVGAFLKTTDIGYIDTVVAIDGIHWGKEEKGCKEDSACMRASAAPWLNFAALAAYGKAPDNATIPPGSHCMVITNSDTPPPECCRKTKYASNYIARTIFHPSVINRDPPAGFWRFKHNPPKAYQPWSGGPGVTYTESQNDWYRAWNNLWIMSYANIDSRGSGHFDHIYQAQVVLPLVIEKIVVPRWNASTGGTVIGV